MDRTAEHLAEDEDITLNCLKRLAYLRWLGKDFKAMYAERDAGDGWDFSFLDPGTATLPAGQNVYNFLTPEETAWLVNCHSVELLVRIAGLRYVLAEMTLRYNIT